MINVRRTRALYESYVNPQNNGPQTGRWGFVCALRNQLGLCDEEGNDYTDRAGNRRLHENRQLRPEEFSFQELAQAVVGPSWQTWFNPNNGQLSRHMQKRSLVESEHAGDSRALLEATGVGIDVSAFADINAWTSVVGGLIEVKILEAWQNPLYISDDLMPVEPTKLNGQKIIGTGRIGDKAEFRRPGQRHRRGGFGERWIQTPETKERALAVDVYKETVFYDLTGNVLREAGEVGDWLRYNKELQCIDEFIGVTNTYVYNGVAFNTYLSTSPFAAGQWLNVQANNDLQSWENIQNVMLLFMRMTDPTTNTRVLVMPDTVLVMPGRLAQTNLILGASETETRVADNATQATAQQLQIRRTPGNPYAGSFKKVLTSPLLEQRATDATGLNLSLANATRYWWAFQAGKSHRYMQNWPLTVAQAPANSYEMLDQGIAATYFANERGIPSTWEPRAVVESTN